jgi:hypothetical protein
VDIGKFCPRTVDLHDGTDDNPMNNKTGSDIKRSDGGII